MNLTIRKASVCWPLGTDAGTRMVKAIGSVKKRAGPAGGIQSKNDSATAPAELIAAAHASSFSMALAHELGSKIGTAGEIITTATVTVEHGTDGWTIVDIHLNVAARVPKLTQVRFIEATVRAKTTCLVSRLLRANISMTASLDKCGAPDSA